MILNNFKQFLDKVYSKATQYIDLNNFRIDHIGYQADSSKDYDNILAEVKSLGKLISESIVGNRRVGLFMLDNPLKYKDQEFSLIEVFEPREGQNVKSAWEHAEFITTFSLEEIMSNYPQVNWDTSVLNREEFPMLILSVGEGMRIKFPRKGVLEEAKRLNTGA